jgi:hypothetical protein
MYTERNHSTFPWRKHTYLGKPPGLPTKLSIDTSINQADNNTNVTKIAPLREIEQVTTYILDLKSPRI